MNIDDRIRKLLKNSELTTEEISSRTGIKYSRWTTIRKKDGRARAEEVEALCKVFPEYSMWIASGLTIPESGQICPDLETISEDYGKTGTDTQ